MLPLSLNLLNALYIRVWSPQVAYRDDYTKKNTEKGLGQRKAVQSQINFSPRCS